MLILYKNLSSPADSRVISTHTQEDTIKYLVWIECQSYSKAGLDNPQSNPIWTKLLQITIVFCMITKYFLICFLWFSQETNNPEKSLQTQKSSLNLSFSASPNTRVILCNLSLIQSISQSLLLNKPTRANKRLPLHSVSLACTYYQAAVLNLTKTFSADN